MIKQAVFIGSLLAVDANVHALCFRVNEQVRSNYSQSEAVFVARVMSQRTWDPDMPVREGDETDKGEELGTIFYKVHLNEAIKGSLPTEFEIKTENSSGRVLLNVGGTYLLFVERLEMKDGGKSKFYWLNSYGCGDPEDFAFPKAKDKLLEAKEAKRAAENHEFAKVGVRVVTYPEESSRPVAGKHILLTGMGIRKTGVTSKDGWLWFEVPAGHYTIGSKDKDIGELVLAQSFFTFDVGEGGGWDCVLVKKTPIF